MHREGPTHNGWLGLYGQFEHVLNPTGLDGYVERDVVAQMGHSDDLSAGHDVGVREHGVDRLGGWVASGVVNDGMEGGVQRHGVVGDCKAEVGRVRLAVDHDVIERSLIFSGGRQNAADAFKGAEVGVAEAVGSADGRVSRAVRVEGAEGAGGVDVADGFGIDEDGMEAHELSGSNSGHEQMRDLEVEGNLARFACAEDERGVVNDELVDENLNFALLRSLRIELRHVVALLFGRQVNAERAD